MGVFGWGMGCVLKLSLTLALRKEENASELFVRSKQQGVERGMNELVIIQLSFAVFDV